MWKQLSLLLIIISAQSINAQNLRTSILYDRMLKNCGSVLESMNLLGEQTAITPRHRLLYADINGRTNPVNSDNSLANGFLSSLNTRVGLYYSPLDNLIAGIGYTTDSSIVDLNVKYSILQAGGPYNKPIALTIFANLGYRGKSTQNQESSERLSSFFKLMVAGKFSQSLSLQGSLNLAYHSSPRNLTNDKDEVLAGMEKIHISASILGRYKLLDRLSIASSITQPITKHFIYNPAPNTSLGIEYNIPSYTIQVFIANYNQIVPQLNTALNDNDYAEGEFIVGITIGKFFFL